MKKVEAARASVAYALLGVPAGGRIPRTLDLASRAQVGNGTIQAALSSLESEGAIVTSAHGASGRRLVSSDLTALWRHSELGALSGVIPLPESREFAGIATAISAEAAAQDFPVQLMFRQGNQMRLRQLRDGVVHFTVLSTRAAEAARDDIAHFDLGDYTYYSRNAVVVIRPRGASSTPPLRVAIDHQSSDHTELTLREFPYAEHVNVPYLFIPEAIANGSVDAAVWHKTTSSPLLTATGLDVRELTTPGPDPDPLNAASVAWRAADDGIGRLLTELLQPQRIREIQAQVMAGERIPEF